MIKDPNVIVGLEDIDDAGVYRLSDSLALIQTIDYFTPIVDDPYTFGQIAAANALSDVYAMGGKPITAMNVVCFPSKTMDLLVLRKILEGGLDILREAQVALVQLEDSRVGVDPSQVKPCAGPGGEQEMQTLGSVFENRLDHRMHLGRIRPVQVVEHHQEMLITSSCGWCERFIEYAEQPRGCPFDAPASVPEHRLQHIQETRLTTVDRGG